MVGQTVFTKFYIVDFLEGIEDLTQRHEVSMKTLRDLDSLGFAYQTILRVRGKETHRVYFIVDNPEKNVREYLEDFSKIETEKDKTGKLNGDEIGQWAILKPNEIKEAKEYYKIPGTQKDNPVYFTFRRVQ